VNPHGQHGGIDPIPGGTRRNLNGCNVFVTIQTSWGLPMEETQTSAAASSGSRCSTSMAQR
jgi:hypothetical protein